MNAEQVAWVSSYPFGRFHIETDASAANNEGDFESICGITGTVLFQRGAKRVPEEIRCSQCFQLSSVTGIDEIESGEGQSDSGDVRGTPLQAGDVSSSLTPTASVVGWANGKPPAVIEITDQGKAPQRGIDSLRVGDEGGEVSEASPLKSLPCSLAKDRDGVGGTMEGHGDVCIRQHTVIPDGDAASENQASPSDSQSLPVHPRSGETGAADCTSLDAAPEKYIGRFDSSTNHFMEFVGARLADAAFIRSAQFCGKVISKCEDVPLEEGYRLEDLDAERESLGVR